MGITSPLPMDFPFHSKDRKNSRILYIAKRTITYSTPTKILASEIRTERYYPIAVVRENLVEPATLSCWLCLP